MSTKFSDAEEAFSNQERSKVDLELIARGVHLILEGIGEDPLRAGLQETPRRVAEMYAELTAGMREDAKQHVVPLPGDKHDEMVIAPGFFTPRSVMQVCSASITTITPSGFKPS